MLDVSGIAFAYDGRQVLNDVGFRLAAGRMLAVLGPNGVGKTTLIKCINRILEPQGGVILIDRDDVRRLSSSEIATRVGYVAQKSEPARLSVFDTVLMGRIPHMRWKPSRKDLERTEQALGRLGLHSLAFRHVDQLSGGELQKVAIARALAQEPRLLLLDEPTSSLDLRNQFEILSLLRELATEHRMATVMTMHDLNTALRFADEFLLLKQGRVLAHGRVEDVTGELVHEAYGLPVRIHRLDGVPVVIPV